MEKYNSDFLIVINNDVYITQNNFLKVIEDDYKKYKFDNLTAPSKPVTFKGFYNNPSIKI